MNTHAPAENAPFPQPDEQKLTCSVCQKEIPISAAFTPEGMDYVGQFCGIECYEQFVARSQKDQGGEGQGGGGSKG